MIRCGNIIGDNRKASSAVRPGKGRRTRTKAAGVAITVAQTATATPTPSDRKVAETHKGDSRICRYHCNEKPVGGHSIKAFSLNEIGTTKSVGNARKPSSSRATSREPPDRPCRWAWRR